MLKFFLMLLLIVISSLNISCAQDASYILHQSQQKVSELQTCSYLLYGKTKVTGMRDTTYQTGKCSYIKINSDTVLGRYICIDNFSGVKEVYNGSIYFKSRVTDSTVYIWDANKFNFFRQQIVTNPVAYSPLFNKKNFYSQLSNDKETTFTLLNDTSIDNVACYHIKTFTKKLRDNIETGITVAADLFIRKTDYMPIGHIQLLQSNINNAINNYESYFLENLTINQVVDESVFSIASIPETYTLKQQGTINIKNYIVAKEQIPDFDYPALKSAESYKNINGKNVLIGVITSGMCIPCLPAIKIMEEFYEQYSKKNLAVLLISTEGLNKDLSENFLIAQQKTFPSLFSGQQIIDKNGLNVFPVFYLLDDQGTTVYKTEGFNERLKAELLQEIDHLVIK